MRQEWVTYWQEFRSKSLISIAWSVVISLMFFAANFPFLKKGEAWFSLSISLVYGACISFSIISCYSIMWAIVTRNQIKNETFQEPTRMMNTILGLVAAGIGVILASYVTALIIGKPLSFSNVWYSLILSCFIALMFIFYYSYKSAEEDNVKLKAAKIESELHVLKNQMQPHFLFNSLNSLLELVETNNQKAPEMTMKLSSLYREILENSKKNFATLESEVSIIKKYLDLEKLRFGERLDYSIKTPPNGEGIYLPPLILQTLVENAIKHGVSPSIEGGKVEVDILKKNDHFYLCVKNSGCVDLLDKKMKGTGLENTKSRLSLVYGDSHNFQIIKDGPFVVASFNFSGELING